MTSVRSCLRRCLYCQLRSSVFKFLGVLATLTLIYLSVYTNSIKVHLFSYGLRKLTIDYGTSTERFSSSTTLMSPLKTTVYLNQNEPITTNKPSTASPTKNTTVAVVKNITIDADKTGPLYLTTIFQSRLGNHLFIYASLLGIARAQNRIPFIHSGTLLDNVFQITQVNDNISTEGFRLMAHPTFGVLDPNLRNLPKENITLHGPREVFRYFENIEAEIRREFIFCVPLHKQINETLAKVRAESKDHIIVGVHARRGDFLSSYNKKIGFGVPNASYFKNAFQRMRSELNNTNVTFLVASDDLKWCHENLNFTDVKILDPGSPVLHFGVLANCDHVILSSGTYGWWAAWLANGISIYYDGYFVNGSQLRKEVSLPDYYPPGWIAVGD